MNKMDNKRMADKTHKNWKLSNPVIVGIIELVIFYVGAVLCTIVYYLIRLFAKSQDAVVDEFLGLFFTDASFIIIIMLCLLFMKKTRPETLKVFSKGVVGYLLIRISDNFWIACGFHSAWNYTQQYLFGIPNSGTSSKISLFQGTELQKNFFFDPVYGNEGSMMTTICLLVLVVVLVVCMTRQKKNP